MKTSYYFLLIILLASTCFYQCSDLVTEVNKGAVLANQYCSNCHLYPAPDLLDQRTWKDHVLPRMGAFLGIYESGYSRSSLIEYGAGGTMVSQAKIYPDKPILSQANWEIIKAFYLKNAPKHLPLPNLSEKITSTRLFKADYPGIFLSPPSTTFVDLDNNQIRFADANKGILVSMDGNHEVLQQAKTGEGVVHLEETSDAIWLTIMGSFSPTDAPKGYILKLEKQASTSAKIIIDQLQRPVHSKYADLNDDGLMDIIVAEYGKWTGGVSLHTQQADGTFKRKYLLKKPGAIKSELIDANKDGKMDIITLFGQGDEGFILFKNEGNGIFSPQPFLRFHPSMGSSSFRLFDWNQDGKKDIIYTAGDNADYPPITKPYHGIYIFEQQENFTFSEIQFFPMPGAYGAIPADFEGDGDIDLAAISFFPDYKTEQPLAFSFFEKDDNAFTHYIVDLKNQGRWLIFDSGDIDNDGDQDLILGALTLEAPGHDELMNKWVNNGIPYVLLKNQSKH